MIGTAQYRDFPLLIVLRQWPVSLHDLYFWPIFVLRTLSTFFWLSYRISTTALDLALTPSVCRFRHSRFVVLCGKNI